MDGFSGLLQSKNVIPCFRLISLPFEPNLDPASYHCYYRTRAYGG